jgi:hypothetical protein
MTTPDAPPPAGGDEPGRGLSGVQRAGIILGGLAVLLIAFLLIRSGGDDSGDQASSSAPQTTATQTTTGTTSTATTDTGATTGTTEAGDDNGSGGGGSDDGGSETGDDSGSGGAAVQTVNVVNGQPEGGVQKLSFKKGDQVRFKVVSDVADEIHVHGYDIKRDVEKGGSVSFSFKGTIEGRFEVELENAGTQIADLEVTPS